MTISERDRHHMIRALEETFGDEVAMTLAEHLPPSGWADVATKHDLVALEQHMNLRFEAFEHRFEAFEHRLFRELAERQTEQMRAIVVAFVTSLIAFGGLVFTAAMFAR